MVIRNKKGILKRLFVLQHVDIEGPGLFAEIAKKRGYSIIIIKLYKGDKLPNVNNQDLVLILGGPMGVNDISTNKYLWLKEEVAFIKSLLKNKISIIGICLGAQLLAYASGGNIKKLKGVSPRKVLPEIGWLEIFSRSKRFDNELIRLLEKPLRVLHWHEDRILLPPSAELIASTKRCEEQLFKINKNSYGLQFHLEVDEVMAERWINKDKRFIINALGDKGQDVLRKQNKIYPRETLKRRIFIINKLIEITNEQ